MEHHWQSTSKSVEHVLVPIVFLLEIENNLSAVHNILDYIYVDGLDAIGLEAVNIMRRGQVT